MGVRLQDKVRQGGLGLRPRLYAVSAVMYMRRCSCGLWRYITFDVTNVMTSDDVIMSHLVAVLLTRWAFISDVTFTCVNLLMTSANDGAN